MKNKNLYLIEIYAKSSNNRTATFLCDREELTGTRVNFFKDGEHVMYYDIRQCYHKKTPFQTT